MAEVGFRPRDLGGMANDLTGDTVELLQTLIPQTSASTTARPSRGSRTRNADVLQSYVEGPGVDIERWGAHTPGAPRSSPASPGTDPNAPSMCLMGHTDVVPVKPRRVAHHDPFGGELIRSAAGARRGVGSRRGRHAQPHPRRWRSCSGRSSDAGSVPRATCCTSRSPTRRPAARTVRAGSPTSTPTRSDATTLLTESGGLHHGGEGQSQHRRRGWGRRASPGAGSGCVAPLATARCRSARTTPLVTRPPKGRQPPRGVPAHTALSTSCGRGQVASLDLPDDNGRCAARTSRRWDDFPRGDLPNPGAPTSPPRMHPHPPSPRTSSPRRARPKTKRDPRRDRPRHRHPHTPRRAHPRGDRPPARRARGTTCSTGSDVEILMDDPSSMSRIDTPAVGTRLQRAVSVAVPRRNPQPTVHGWVHRRSSVP